MALALSALGALAGWANFSKPAAAPNVTVTFPQPDSPPTPTTTAPPNSTAATSTARSTTTTVTVTNPPSADGWYDLVEYQSSSWANGFDPVDPIRIGGQSFPASIVGYYQSSASDPNDRATWTVGGVCTRFQVAIGKDAESPSSAGVGRFVVKADDAEIFASEKSMNDQPELVDLDITGKVRLTLFDTRKLTDAKNAWGRPRVNCTAPPGRKR